jgi:hypothetical protein
MRDQFDRSSKWLLQHHGDSILWLGDIGPVRSWRPLQAEVVQPRQLPDGQLEVELGDRSKPRLVLIEVATYPEMRLAEQVARNCMLVYLDRRVVPDVLTLVLKPKGSLRVAGLHRLESGPGTTRIEVAWRVVELWTVPAEQRLAARDVGLIPWVPLTRMTAPPENVLAECRRQIDANAPAHEHANLLAVAQVLARLRYNKASPLKLFGGKQTMIESPLIQELMSERMHKAITSVLEARFGHVPKYRSTLNRV